MGGYNAYDKDAWNDEVLVGDKSGDKQTVVKQLIEDEGRQSEFVGESGLLQMAGLKRTTAADRDGDLRSLDRALSRTLYLLVKRPRPGKEEGSYWSFPNGTLEGKEGLKEVSS